MNFYPFHIGDYLSHTNHLSNEEDLAYRRMIDIYYQSEQPFNDRSTLARRIRASVETVDVILNEFFVLEDDGCWHNKRVDEEIAKYHGKLTQASKAGKASAEARLNNRSTTVQPTNNQEPITKNHNVIRVKKTPKIGLPEDFCISESIKAWASKNGYSQLDKHFEYFVDSAKSNGYMYADWDAAFRKAISGNWAKVGQVKSDKVDIFAPVRSL